MSSNNLPKQKKQSSKKARVDYRWLAAIFGMTVAISGAFSFISGELLQESGIAVSFIVLLLIILIGIVFDVIGISVAAANEQPFHSMASRKVPEAKYALRLLRKADRVSTFCNDVIGDICGVVSGAAAVVIAVRAATGHGSTAQMVTELLMSALVAAFTVGGKAMGKSFAISESTKIVHFAGKILYFFKQIGQIFHKK